LFAYRPNRLGKKIKMPMFFTSDHHFKHANIMKYCNRPFDTIEKHDSELIYEWNNIVNRGDVVYHLGDFTLGGWENAKTYFSQLNGSIIILGNRWHHDKCWLSHFSNCVSLSGEPVLITESLVVLEHMIIRPDQHFPIVLCHFPFEEWDRKHYGSLHFHGHSHGTLPHVKNRLDVGIDNAYKLTGRYRPLELGEAIEFAREE
jgi:calcineurin-like phosphoesterase family protein